ncbi:hypothetical protein RJT34_03081 [Clitoria ternatea]|uniref:Uncharacterized protein n=1 Tax=Clitoria ternatea TaxID=43366 RepID=A0AAN9KLJ6_CLITE
MGEHSSITIRIMVDSSGNQPSQEESSERVGRRVTDSIENHFLTMKLKMFNNDGQDICLKCYLLHEIMHIKGSAQETNFFCPSELKRVALDKYTLFSAG